jgi:ISXO2-like transposase domain
LPHCGSLKTPYKVKARGKFTNIPSYRCSERPCDLPFTVRTKSIYEGSKIPFRTWLLAFYELGTRKKSISSVELATRIGTTQKTAWLINHKIRAMLKDINPELLKDYAAVDETRIGGKEKNKHANKKRQHTEGGWDKTLVFGAIGLGGKVKAKVVPDADGATLLPIVKKWIAAKSLMVSDELSSYSALKGDYWLVSINHSAGEYARGGFSTNGMENF